MNKRSLFTAAHCISRSVYFRLYSISEGFSHNAVITMVQGRFGFMWLGTPDAFNRFDGCLFKVYRAETNPTSGRL